MLKFIVMVIVLLVGANAYAEQPDEDTEHTITLKLSQINEIMTVLRKCPMSYDVSAPLLGDIFKQLHVTAKPETAKPN